MSSIAQAFVTKALGSSPVVIFTKSYCPFCKNVKSLLDNANIAYKDYEIENNPQMDAIQDYLRDITGARSVPRVFIGGKSIGGCDDTTALSKSGQLSALAQAAMESFKKSDL